MKTIQSDYWKQNQVKGIYYDKELVLLELAKNMMQLYGDNPEQALESARSMEAGAYIHIDATFRGRDVREISELDMALAVVRALVFDWGTSALDDSRKFDLLAAPFLAGLQAEKIPLSSVEELVEDAGYRHFAYAGVAESFSEAFQEKVNMRSILMSDSSTYKAAYRELRGVVDAIPHDALLEGVITHRNGIHFWVIEERGFVEYFFHKEEVPFTTILVNDFEPLDERLSELLDDALRSPEQNASSSSGVYAYYYELLGKDCDTPTLYKVGRSKDVPKRLKQQNREASKTVKLGHLVPARFYPASNPVHAERVFHEQLKKSGAHRKASGSGNEWFETTLTDLDRIASTNGLYPANSSENVVDTQRRRLRRPHWSVLLHY